MKKNLYLMVCVVLIVSFLCTSLISAVPPVQVLDSTTGFHIRTAAPESIKINEMFDFHTHVFNETNGVPINTGISCYLHLYNLTGHHIFDGIDTTASRTFDYSWDVPATNFTMVGEVPYLISCNSSTQGGFIASSFYVTTEGHVSIENNSFVSAGLFLLAFGVSIFFLILFINIDSPPIKLFFFMLSFIFLIGSLLLAMVVGYNSGLPEAVTNTLMYFMYAVGLVFTIIFMFVLIKQITGALDMMREKKGYEVGF